MATCRDIIARAMRLIGAVDAASVPSAIEEANGMEALQASLLSLPAIGMGNAWTDVDVSADYTAGENERVRIVTTDPVTVTLPQTVARSNDCFNPGITLDDFLGTADSTTRAPLNGARVQVVGATNRLYFYSSTAGDWTELTGLTPSSAQPLGPEHDGGVAAILAVQLAPEFGPEASPTVQRMAQLGLRNIRLRFGQPVVVRANTPWPSLQSFGRC